MYGLQKGKQRMNKAPSTTFPKYFIPKGLWSKWRSWSGWWEGVHYLRIDNDWEYGIYFFKGGGKGKSSLYNLNHVLFDNDLREISPEELALLL